MEQRSHGTATAERTIREGRTLRQGDSWSCSTCGSEIRVIRAGDPRKVPPGETYACACGTRMDLQRTGPYRSDLTESRGQTADGS
jgi:hypothetical protein